MAEETGTLDPTKEELDELEQLETSLQDSDEDSEELKTLKEQNRHLFARAKKAEGWSNVDGEWVKKPLEIPKEPPKTEASTVKPEDITKTVDERLLQRDIEALDVSENLQKEVQDYVALHKVSVKKALDSSYLKFMMEEENKNKKIEDASLGGKSKATKKDDFSEKSPMDFDLATEEGRNDWEKYQKWLQSQ